MSKTVTLVLGYKTRAIDKIEELATAIAPGDVEWQQLAGETESADAPPPKVSGFADSAAALPFFATIDELAMLDPYAENADGSRGKYRYYRHDPDGEKPPVSARFREYLFNAYPEAWSDENRTVFRFVAFNADLFARILAFDCARPGPDAEAADKAKPRQIPFATWNADLPQHVSLVTTAVPPGMAAASVAKMLALWRPHTKMAKLWDEFVEAWPEYNLVPRRECLVATELASALGLI